MSKEKNQFIKTLPNKDQDQTDFTGEYYYVFKEELMLIFLILFPKTDKEGRECFQSDFKWLGVPWY